MNLSSIESVTTVLSLVMGITSLVGGFLLWHRGSVEKRYAAERDFAHIRNDFKSLSANLAHEAEETERSFNELRFELKECKALLLAQTQRFESILTRLELNTTGWSRKHQE